MLVGITIILLCCLHSFYGDLSGDSVQIFTKAPPGISKFECPYQPSYIFNSPYMYPSFKRVRKIKHVFTLEIMERDIDERTSVDINSLRGLEDPRAFNKFD